MSATVTSYGNGSIIISGLSKTDIEAIQGMVLGANYIGVNDQREIQVFDKLKRLPDPIAEPWEGESWVHSNQTDGIKSTVTCKEWGEPGKDYGFSIIIQHLCGYGYTRENNKREAAKLQSYGFACLRSRRALDGKRWELWYLPGLWAAEGELLAAFPTRFPTETKTPEECEAYRKHVVKWFCENVAFGTIDLMVQRAAQVID